MKRATVDLIGNICAGKRVALVGNSPGVMDYERGPEIDGHDIVVRINGGVPGFRRMSQPERPEKTGPIKFRPRGVPETRHIGTRTDILSTATFKLASAALRLCDPRALVWTKHTKTGAADLRKLYHWLETQSCPRCRWSDTRLIMYPLDVQEAMAKEIGEQPSSGPRLVRLLHDQGAFEVTLYGFDCFGATGDHYSSWWGYEYFGGRRLSHNGDLEAAYLKGLGYEFENGRGVRRA